MTAAYAYPYASTALLMIDPMNDFVHPDGKLWPYLRAEAEKVDLVANQTRALQAARASGLRVVYVPHHRHADGDYERFRFLNPTHQASIPMRPFPRDGWGGDWLDALRPWAGDLVCAEHWFQSGFQNTDLDYLLRQHGIDHLVLTGQRTNACFEMTGRYGVELGYHVTLLRDATAAFTALDVEGTFNTARTWAHLVLTTDEFLAAVAPQSAAA
jgi:nicotinamidase-related amidase